MRILVNATSLTKIKTGIGRYVSGLYEAMERLYPDAEIRYFDGTAAREKPPVPPNDSGSWAGLVSLLWKMPDFVPLMLRLAVDARTQRAIFKAAQGFDIYHEPGFFPFRMPEGTATAFTIHDLSLIEHPEFHPSERVKYFNSRFPKAVRNADGIITPSLATGRATERLLPDVPVPICPTWLGFDSQTFRPASAETLESVRAKFGLPDEYALFAGTMEPRKNMRLIRQAWDLLEDPPTLVCAGWSGWGDAGSPPTGSHCIGYVSDEELAALYTGASMFLYPSWYEGFGLPVLEAMACGCPVICSNVTSLPEVGGDAVLYTHPKDVRTLAQHIRTLQRDRDMQRTLSRSGLHQAHQFSWDNTAARTMEFFKELTHRD